MARNHIIIRRSTPPDEDELGDDQNPINDHYNDEFNSVVNHNNPDSASNKTENEHGNNDDKNNNDQDSNNTAKDLNDQENNNSDKNSSTKNDKRAIADREQTSSERWRNNTSPVSKDGYSKRNIKSIYKVKAAGIFIKKRSAALAIIALLGGGASIPFIGMTSLPMSILGNLDAKSLLQPLSAYLQDYYGFRFFGTSKKGSVAADGETFAGLRDTEIEELKKKGVEFPGEGKKLKNGKVVYDKIIIDGKEITPASFKQDLRQNPRLRKKVIFQKGSYFKSAKSAATKKVKSLFKYSTDPGTVKSDTPEEKDKNIVKQSTEGTSSDTTSSSTGAKEGESTTSEYDKAKADAEDVSGTMKENIDTAKENPLDSSVVGSTDYGNPSASRLGAVDDVATATKNVGQKIFSYIDTLDIADAACTVYQVAYSATLIARTVALVNIIRYAIYIRSVFEQAKKGEDVSGEAMYILNKLIKVDPSTGLSFDRSSFSQMLFNGSLTGEPSGISAIGGSLLATMYNGMHAFHAGIGDVFPDVVFGKSDAGKGRKFLKEACKLATNLGVQVSVTLGEIALGILTFGSSTAATTTAKVTAKTAFTFAKDTFTKNIIKKFSKEAIGSFIKEETAKVGEKLAIKNLRKSSTKLLKNTAKDLIKKPWQAIGLVAGLTGTFGMPFLVHALSGANVAGALNNGILNMDAIGTGLQAWEMTNGIASGGTMATYSAATAYESTLKEYRDAYIADMKYDARNTPFDIQNPYSTLGSALFSMQKTLGVANTTNFSASIIATIGLPFKLLSDIVTAAREPITQEKLGENSGNPYFIENKISTQVMGSANVIFKKTHSFADIMEQIGPNSSNPMIEYSGDDEKTGEPKLSIKSGTKLAEYADQCHNPDRTEVDPEFQNDEGSNLYDFNKCAVGGSSRDKDAELYSDAIAFIHQVSPSEEDSNSASSSSTSTSLPSGDAKEVATSILNNSKITYSHPDLRQEIQDTADGKAATPVALDARLLQVIAALGNNHTIRITSLGRNTNCSYSVHCLGEAVDIDTIDGTSLNGRDEATLKILQEIVDNKLLPPGAGIGQSTCPSEEEGGTPTPERATMNEKLTAAGYVTHNDFCNHMHLALRWTVTAEKKW